MTCAATIPTATASAVSATSPHPVTSAPSPYAPASSTAHGPNSDGVTHFIASRCRKLQFRSNESRKRFLAVHRALATYSAGDA